MTKQKLPFFLFNSLGIVLLVLLASCMKQVNMRAYRPAAISIPAHVKTVLLLDRTEYKNKKVDILEGILTGEGIAEDRNGVIEAISSLQNTLLSSPRFEVKRASERLQGNNLLGTFPEPISWKQIENMCLKYQADAVIAIEVFDTNFLITDGKRNVKKTIEDNGQKREVEVVEYYAQGIATANLGFRIYDLKSKAFADQQMFKTSNTWEGKGSSIKDAIALLINKSEATKYVSQSAGSSYANKIAPMPITISRSFYSKSKQSNYLTSGVRQAEVNKWAGALETWRAGLGHSNNKTAGRLCYNIAIAYEVLGDLDMAKEWSERSYVTYGNKKAREYSNILNYRIRNENIVKEQLN